MHEEMKLWNQALKAYRAQALGRRRNCDSVQPAAACTRGASFTRFYARADCAVSCRTSAARSGLGRRRTCVRDEIGRRRRCTAAPARCSDLLSGGIGGRHLRTTSLLLDHDILIDAGTGVGDLSLAELTPIDHIFLTHSHLDHVASIPFLVDTVGGMRDEPLTVHAIRADDRDPAEPPLQLGDLARLHRRSRRRARRSCATRRSSSAQSVDLGGAQDHGAAGEPHGAGGRLPARQRQGRAWCSPATPPPTTSCGRSSTRSRTSSYLIIETAFCNRERELAIMSKHLCPRCSPRSSPSSSASCRDLHHPSQAGRDRADHAGDRGMRRPVPAAHAAEQPGVRVLRP